MRLFRNGRNQAVRIPREFELPGDGAIMRRVGDTLVIEPEDHDPLVAALNRMAKLDDEIGEIEDLPPEPIDL